jgi:hypothetical protein
MADLESHSRRLGSSALDGSGHSRGGSYFADFLEETDSFDTKKFDPWRQKTIYEYTRRDVPDTFEIPRPLADFFLKQIDIYGGASDATLQRLRYVRDAVFVRTWTTEQAARDAENRRSSLPFGSTEDAAALQNFAADMRLEPLRH